MLCHVGRHWPLQLRALYKLEVARCRASVHTTGYNIEVHLCFTACWRAKLMGHDAGFLPGISGGLQSLLLDPNTLSSLYGAMGTTSGAFLALSQLPGINMDAVHVRLHRGPEVSLLVKRRP